MTKWNRFLYQFQKDVKLWLFAALYLSLFRSVFVFSFRNKIGESWGWRDVLFAFLNGFRYDSMVSTYWVLVPFLLSVGCGFFDTERFAERTRNVLGSLFVILSTLLCVVTLGYFREFDDQFNHFLFNLYYDDARAIFLTIWAEYHPLLYLAAIGVVIYLMLVVKDLFLKKDLISRETLTRPLPFPVRVVISLIIVFLLFGGTRGTFKHRPAQRDDAAITKDEFLNKAVLNPYFSLLYAFQEQRDQTGTTGLEMFIPDRNVRKAAQYVFSTHAALNNIDDYLRRPAAGPKNKPARHVFLVLMESYDAWPLMKRYESLGLTNSLKQLARKGLHFESFLPASDGTMSSLTAILTGLPYAGLEINYQNTSRKTYPSSLAETFKRLGYKTRFFYGGYLSWQKAGDFARAQGFEELYGAGHMSSWTSIHEWGLEDEYLFDFVTRTVDDARPSFNFILTTSYHPPYKIDVRKKGFSLEKVPDDLAPLFDGRVDLNMLGHLWYADRCIGVFVQNTEKKLHRAVFAFTGDHYGRKFINARPDYFERSAVPLILYGTDVLRGISLPKGAAGSHIDIGPTLVELAAPKGFAYYAVGNNLLAPRSRFLGTGWWKVIGPDFILSVADSKYYPLPFRPLPQKLPEVKELQQMLNSAYGIGWWRVKQGPEL